MLEGRYRLLEGAGGQGSVVILLIFVHRSRCKQALTHRKKM